MCFTKVLKLHNKENWVFSEKCIILQYFTLKIDISFEKICMKKYVKLVFKILFPWHLILSKKYITGTLIDKCTGRNVNIHSDAQLSVVYICTRNCNTYYFIEAPFKFLGCMSIISTNYLFAVCSLKPSSESRGEISFYDPEHGNCSNPEPVPGWSECGGACSSGSRFNSSKEIFSLW